MCDTCDDSRFELIKKYKQRLLDATNIDDSPEEMAVIDNILFRFWQMGWLAKLELFGNSEQLNDIDRQTILNLPSAQPEIIRCGDCVYKPCKMMPYSYDDDFCSYAERKTDGI